MAITSGAMRGFQERTLGLRRPLSLLLLSSMLIVV
jgi:hypothetical protein